MHLIYLRRCPIELIHYPLQDAHRLLHSLLAILHLLVVASFPAILTRAWFLRGGRWCFVGHLSAPALRWFGIAAPPPAVALPYRW